YYFLEKNKGLEELPPHYYTTDIDSASARLLNIRQRTQFQAGAFMTYSIIEKYDYMEVLANTLKQPAFLNIKNKLNYSESTFIDLISLYNRRNGEPNGGILKTKLVRKIFYGANVGLISLIYDPNISDTKLFSTFAFKAYGLYPLTGVNKNVSAKLAVNYYTYENETYRKAIPSASFGLRLNSITGFFRPYLEGSLGVSALLRNSRPVDFGFPLILEVGGLIPIKDHYLTIGISRTPIVLRKLNGYEFWSYHIGILF
ncbi:MAG TPA: hypothetical protein V6C58_05840, partial [Allocoleopsis sp.]